MLTEINLYQFKRFQDELIEFFPLTLLTGINGMGKSSVIQSLLTLRQSFDKGELRQRNQLVIEDDQLANLVSPDDMLCSKAIDNTVAFELKDSYGNGARWSLQAEGKSNTLPVVVDQITGDIFASNLFADNFQYLSAERLGPRIIYDRSSVKRYHSPLGYRGEFSADKILEVLTSLEKTTSAAFDKKKEPATVYDQLSFWLSEIVYPGSRVSASVAGASQIELSYAFREEHTKVFNPVNVGFGFSYALPVILAVLMAKPGSLLIIENPEAHLHPKGQSSMGMFLGLAANNGIQIITETHSDHVLNGIRMIAKGGTPYGDIDPGLVKIHFFYTGNQAVGNSAEVKRSLDLLSDGNLTGWPKNFFDEWENNLRFLIT
jgi:predicted ATPase